MVQQPSFLPSASTCSNWQPVDVATHSDPSSACNVAKAFFTVGEGFSSGSSGIVCNKRPVPFSTFSTVLRPYCPTQKALAPGTSRIMR